VQGDGVSVEVRTSGNTVEVILAATFNSFLADAVKKPAAQLSGRI